MAGTGLPGYWPVFCTLVTGHRDGELAGWLLESYPGEMTIVMQHGYGNLVVAEDGFSITRNFGDSPEPLYIPYDAIKTFVDPSVEFGLRFESTDEEDEENPLEEILELESETDEVVDLEPKQDAEVVPLDSFRK